MRILLLALFLAIGPTSAWADGAVIYRCGDAYKSSKPGERVPAGCVRMAPKQLNADERARFDACRMDASKAPTEIGVQAGLRVCRERFEQQ